MHPHIAQHRAGISAICQQYGICRLDVFGSAAQAKSFDVQTSDADFLVEFTAESKPTFREFFGARAALETLLGRNVDLLEAKAVRNPFLLDSINRCRETIYAA
jgi:uncharacterized protein